MCRCKIFGFKFDFSMLVPPSWLELAVNRSGRLESLKFKSLKFKVYHVGSSQLCQQEWEAWEQNVHSTRHAVGQSVGTRTCLSDILTINGIELYVPQGNTAEISQHNSLAIWKHFPYWISSVSPKWENSNEAKFVEIGVRGSRADRTFKKWLGARRCLR